MPLPDFVMPPLPEIMPENVVEELPPTTSVFEPRLTAPPDPAKEETVSLPPKLNSPLLIETAAESDKTLAAVVASVPPSITKLVDDIATAVESRPALTVVVPVKLWVP